MENSLLLIFGEIWPNFGVTLKNRKKFNLDQNELKHSMQHKYMYMHKEKI